MPPAVALASLGMPIVCGRLDDAGDPDVGDKRWGAWQRRSAGAASLRAADSWKPGSALAGVTGVVFDVLDVDPRNGGDESLRALSRELGDSGPEVYWRIRTPRGGSHLYVAPLGIGSHNGWRPGLDLKGGYANGEGRGFVFLPPTVRYGRRYRVLESGGAPNGSGPCLALREIIERSLSTPPSGGGGLRRPLRELRTDVLTAGSGEQRLSLLRYVHELERKGVSRDGILARLRKLAGEMKNFDPRDPWYPAKGRNPERHLRGLLHAPGAVLGDGTAGELAGLSAGEKESLGSLGAGKRPSTVSSFDTISEAQTSWLWELYLAAGEITLIDGEKAVGKSGTWLDVAARGSRGAPMPGEDRAIVPAFDTLILSPENRLRHTIKPRLRAAGADMSRLFFPRVPALRRGAPRASAEFLLPGSAEAIRQMIRDCGSDGARLLIIDPIVAFLDPAVNSHNDASVRMALSPLSRVLSEEDCAAGFSRNMNKNKAQDAKDRGSGSRAFADLARVHLLAQRLPSEYTGEGDFGLTFGDTNLTRRESRTLAFSIEDSAVSLDDRGRFVSRLVWHGLVDVTGVVGASRRGPAAIAVTEVSAVLMEMFSSRDTWTAASARAELSAAGVSVNSDTVAKALSAVGAARLPVQKAEGGFSHWVWTVVPQKKRTSGGRGARPGQE